MKQRHFHPRPSTHLEVSSVPPRISHVLHLNRKALPLAHNHGRAPQQLRAAAGEAFAKRRAHDDYTQLGPQQRLRLLREGEREICVEGALVELVEDNRGHACGVMVSFGVVVVRAPAVGVRAQRNERRERGACYLSFWRAKGPRAWEGGVPLEAPDEHPLGDDLDARAGAHAALEADREADRAANLLA